MRVPAPAASFAVLDFTMRSLGRCYTGSGGWGQLQCTQGEGEGFGIGGNFGWEEGLVAESAEDIGDDRKQLAEANKLKMQIC